MLCQFEGDEQSTFQHSSAQRSNWTSRTTGTTCLLWVFLQVLKKLKTVGCRKVDMLANMGIITYINRPLVYGAHDTENIEDISVCTSRLHDCQTKSQHDDCHITVSLAKSCQVSVLV